MGERERCSNCPCESKPVTEHRHLRFHVLRQTFPRQLADVCVRRSTRSPTWVSFVVVVDVVSSSGG